MLVYSPVRTIGVEDDDHVLPSTTTEPNTEDEEDTSEYSCGETIVR